MLDDVPLRSSFTWLDFSEHERRKALDVIDMFRDHGTVDELGLGTVRDALANTLFPGTSTIQTRARYFLFIPWCYRVLEARAPKDVAASARQMELRLIEALESGGEKEGVIGIDARAKLKRLPSNVYWQGLTAWGIRRGDVTQAEYHRNFQRFGKVIAARDDEDLPGGGITDLWHANLPDAPAKFLDETTFELRRGEAEYLRERLQFTQQQSLLAWLVENSKSSEVEFPWLHPDFATFPEALREQLHHARMFGLAMQGAALAYNLYLAQLLKDDDAVSDWEGWIQDWAEEVEKERPSLVTWSRDAFWILVRTQNPRIGVPTQKFIEEWIKRLLAHPAGLALIQDNNSRQLIERREFSLKRNLSRMLYDEPRLRWRGDSGSGRMDFRWFRTQVILNDILRGLGRA
jgi:hypothetical protein